MVKLPYRSKYYISALLVLAVIKFGLSQSEKISTPSLSHVISDSSRLSYTESGFQLGRFLFYDPILSLDSSISCSNCHKQQFAFADENAFSLGIDSNLTSRNSMPLFNLLWSPSFFWDGRAASLSEQISSPIHDIKEMRFSYDGAVKRLQENESYRLLFESAFPQSEIDSTLIVSALSQFIFSIVSFGSKFDSAAVALARLNKREYLGYATLVEPNQGNCNSCHRIDGSVLGSDYTMSNNGLADFGKKAPDSSASHKFKVPTLRNLSFTAPYMHDGRFETLEEVLDFYSEHITNSSDLDSRILNFQKTGMHLTEEQKSNILLFLKTLDDYDIISNPRFSNPFVTKR